ncbi:MAG: hypothetical protein V4557_20175 [Bacteroidota bacterium]
MRSKFSCISVVILAAMVIVSCSSSKNSQQYGIAQSAHWQKDSLVIDGSDSGWTKPLTYHDEKQGLFYSVSNDDRNLYITVSTKNDATILRILRGGMTLYINSHGTKDEYGAAGISFPTGNNNSKGGKLLYDRPELAQDKNIALHGVEDYSLFGFRVIGRPETFEYGQQNAEGVELAIGMSSSKELIYEAKIPLNSFLTRATMVNLNRKSFAVGFVLESMPEQPGNGGGVSVGGGVSLGSYGSGGGVGLSIGTGAIGDLFRKKSKPVKIWKELLFADEPSVK